MASIKCEQTIEIGDLVKINNKLFIFQFLSGTPKVIRFDNDFGIIIKKYKKNNDTFVVFDGKNCFSIHRGEFEVFA